MDPVPDIAGLRRTALALVNDSRRTEGLPPLEMSATLNAAAEAHAEDMARRNFYAHRSPEGRDVADRYRAAGGGDWAIIAENISSCISCARPAGQLRAFHTGWMQSPGHRSNILDPRVDRFGFGMAAAEGRLYAVQTFIREREGYAGDTGALMPLVPGSAGR
ncbi:CAP domain-containing protein [Chelativorans sp. M5D2P16]|uniref:CAP domain-containing protein n=1 Tax=Chelativorans sp. M5D2P16 TaxID=3095678 RepID=UPI002ACABFFC|nr:CAP domain-containing protein [Chelativorans sp. M5D2P16]MDZ5695908.1 CAP domain-containing protein [Chelativorans sp. M5D2P16]